MACFVACCRLFSSVLHCLVVFMACFVVCCRLFSGVHGLLCGVLLTVQCSWPALWCVALFSGVHGPLCDVLQTVQWCEWHALWCVADCSVVWMVCFWLMTTYIALFSALLSRLTALACGSTWVTSFIALFFFFFLTSTEVVYLQCWHGWCHMKLQPSRHKSFVHHTTMHHVTSCKATYVRCMHV